MATTDPRSYTAPGTPRVISPSPTPSEGHPSELKDGYFAPVTRSSSSASASISKPNAAPISPVFQRESHQLENETSELSRARTRSRSPIVNGSGDTRRRLSVHSFEFSKGPKGPNLAKGLSGNNNIVDEASIRSERPTNGHLSPSSASGSGGSYWRELSRSPSPLGLIPIHRQWRSLVGFSQSCILWRRAESQIYQIHRHEIPRKVLHVSIGFFTLYLYTSGTQPSTITPALLTALVPIASVDFFRHRFPPLNRIYVRVCGALMRESEVDGWNGVVWYLVGAYAALRCFPKDIGVMSVLLLSWCDTAASTVGRAYGRYTPRIRRGKTLAGSVAAFVVGVGAAAVFWGWLAPRSGPFKNDLENPFMFTGVLRLPARAVQLLAWSGNATERLTLNGGLALGVLSLWTGLMGAVSEAVDLAGADDNLTIPVLSAVGLWGFLKVFT